MSNVAVWPRRIASGAAKLFTASVAAAATATAFGAISARRFGLRYETLSLLPAGHRPFRILHIGDMHLVEGDRRKIDFVRSLATLAPDMVINTGDNAGSTGAVEGVLDALGPLLQFPGVFVPGSNDFYGPQRANPLRYFGGPSKLLHSEAGSLPNIDVDAMFDGFTTPENWHQLDNRSMTLQVRDDVTLRFAGTGDAHMHNDAWPGFDSGHHEHRGALLNIAVTHAPYRRVLDQAIAEGAHLVFAGHTHGGQVALPRYGAIVSNSDLPTGLAAGLFPWRAHGTCGMVNITAGIGASPTVPLRTFCPPEAVVVELVASSQ